MRVHAVPTTDPGLQWAKRLDKGLLANSNQRRSLASAALQRLPTLSNTLKQTRGSNHPNLPNMASPAMGNGPSWTIANSSRKPLLHHSRRRVLHQMDRSKATSYNNLKIVKRFFWQQIICCFRVPRELIVDNGTQFDSEVFKEFCMQTASSKEQMA